MKKIVVGILGLLLLPFWSLAAANSGSLQGSVLDSGGRPVTGALVTVAAAGPSLLDRLAVTDNRGSFTFENLAAGEYSVQVTKPRFAASREKIQLTAGAITTVRFSLQTIIDMLRRATSRDIKESQDIIWTLRSSPETRPVLRFVDSGSQPIFQRILPEYSGYIQFYSKTDPRARQGSEKMGSRFSVTLGMPADAKVTFSGQYNESPLEPKGASALYEFTPLDGHKTQIGARVRQGVVLDDAFSAEELKEFQVEYTDRFYLTETLEVEEGAEIGHAEGRASNNYFRPKAGVSWVPSDKTVFTFKASMQAPDQSDDPVRGREYFEQVNLPPSLEHYLHTEVGVSRFFGDVTRVSLAVFQDRANNRALFVSAPDGRHGLLVYSGKDTPSQGLRLHVNREFHGFEAGFGYTVASGMGLSANARTLDAVREQMARRPFHVVTARIKTDFDLTNTELTAVYRWISRYAAGPIDPYQQLVEYNDPTLSISVAQNLPNWGFPGKVQAILDARNLFEQSFGSSRTQLAHSPRFVKGGINIRF